MQESTKGPDEAKIKVKLDLDSCNEIKFNDEMECCFFCFLDTVFIVLLKKKNLVFKNDIIQGKLHKNLGANTELFGEKP